MGGARSGRSHEWEEQGAVWEESGVALGSSPVKRELGGCVTRTTGWVGLVRRRCDRVDARVGRTGRIPRTSLPGRASWTHRRSKTWGREGRARAM